MNRESIVRSLFVIFCSFPVFGASVLPQPIAGWRIELIAEAPKIKHPSVVACAPDGRVFVAEDPMDISLPKADATEGRILCFYPDGRITVFAENLYAVFGMQYLEGKLYVVHAPKFSVFTDDNGIGHDRVDLIESLNPKPWALDWNDHVPANFRLAMDGYFYLAVGDKGAYGAVGRDGRRVDLHGGGILRLRPDGTSLEVYSRGVRNILDVALNSEDELFTYDNTDEQLWMGRLTHMVDGGFYGYPYDFIPRRPYTLWCMADYGGGAATGTLAYNEDALPAEFRGNLFLADFGKRQLLRLRIERDGATYKVLSREDLFSDPPDDFRPVGIALSTDGLGIYVCDWNHRDTKESVSVGRLWKLSYTGKSQAAPKPDWFLPAAMGRKLEATNEELVKGLSHPAQSVRLTAQRRLAEKSVRGAQLSRAGRIPALLSALLKDTNAPASARWHALWALDAIDQRGSARKAILAAASDSDPGVRGQAIRQLGTRHAHDAMHLLVSNLKGADASVRLQAAAALGRIADPAAIATLLEALNEQDFFARYAVFTALNRIGRANYRSWPAIAKGLESDNPRVREGTRFALRDTYDAALARALADVVVADSKPVEARAAAVELLAEIHRKKQAWKGEWWAYHPVNSPPAAKTEVWEGTATIQAIVGEALDDHDLRVRHAAVEGVREAKIIDAAPKLREMFRSEADLDLRRSIIAALGDAKDASSSGLLASVFDDAKSNVGLLPEAVTAAQQIATPATAALLVNFLNSNPGERTILLKTIAALGQLHADGGVVAIEPFARNEDSEIRQSAFTALTKIGGDSVVAVVLPLLADPSADIRRSVVNILGELKARSALPELLKAIRAAETKWEAIGALAQMPDERAVEGYLEGLGGKNPTLRTSCRKAIEAIRDRALPTIEVKLDELPSETVAELQKIYADNPEAQKSRLFEMKAKKLEPADYFEFAVKHDGDATHGRKIFGDLNSVACIKCHRIAGEGSDVGPDLTTAGTQFGRTELAESVLYPSKAIREGYQRVEVETKNEETFEGLVKAETNDWLTLRDSNGNNRQISKGDIKDRRNSQLSLMPEGLEAGMTLQDFSDLVSYLTSLKGKPERE
jgi:putative membrane-bound dehydrogenase-like protein